MTCLESTQTTEYLSPQNASISYKVVVFMVDSMMFSRGFPPRAQTLFSHLGRDGNTLVDGKDT